jgi:Flp pilus assembly protein TadD
MRLPKIAESLRSIASLRWRGTGTGRGQRDSLPADAEETAAKSRAPLSWRVTILPAGLIALAAIAAYHNSFAGNWVLDDGRSILENRTIRRLWPIWPVLSPPSEGETVSGRPLLNLSLALNYAVSGLEIWSYHAANLLIHIAAAWLLFGILRRTFLMPALQDRFGTAATLLALASALWWTVHPLQAESVTYISQRAESLAGFFYLLTLYCVIRGADCQGTVPIFAEHDARQNKFVGGEKGDCPRGEKGDCPLLWYAAAVLACLLGIASKEILVTAPLLVLLYDRTFLAGSFAAVWRRRWGLYVGLAATWCLLAYLVLSTSLIGRQAELGAPDPWSYARSQPGVIVHYLRLSVWPSRLCLVEDWPAAKRLGEILPGAMVVAALSAATVGGLIARKAWAFLGAWFLLILAPTSSMLPLAQLTCEHRMYLPLAAIAVLAVAGGYALWDRLPPRPAAQGGQPPFSPGVTRCRLGLRAAKKGTVPDRAAVVRWAAPAVAWAAVLTALGYATVVRNADYRSLLAMSQDIVDKFPNNFKARNDLGIALAAAGRFAEATEHYAQALRLKPDSAESHNNLGIALAALGKTTEAIEHFHQALRLKPVADVYGNLAFALAQAGRTEEAIQQYRQALRYNSDRADIHNNLGNALARAGRFQEAVQSWKQALRLNPDYAPPHNSLGVVLAQMGSTDEAIAHYQEALRLKPDYADAHNNLGLALANLGRTAEAIEHYQRALRLKPDYPEAYDNLRMALASISGTSEAVEQYRRLLQLRPDSVEILNNLAWLLATHEPAQGGDPARAVQLAQRASEVAGPENAQCLDTLAAAYAAAGRFSDAVVTAERAFALAESAGLTALAKKIQSRLELYRAGRAYREAPRSAGS